MVPSCQEIQRIIPIGIRILSEVERVETRRVGFILKRIGKPGLTGWNGYPYTRFSIVPACVRMIE
jgi:hypothetical protein